MAWKTDKIAVGYSSLSNITLDVSGTAMINSLKGTGTRMVTVSPDGSFGTADIPDTSINVLGFFGDGMLGDVTLNASINLAADMSYNNLTINSSVWINTNGFILRILGTLTLATNAHIACDGGNGRAGYQNVASGGIAGATPYTETSGAWPFMGIPGAGGQGQYNSLSGTTSYTGTDGGISDVSTIAYTPYILRAGSGGGGGGAVGSSTHVAPSAPNVGMIAGAGGSGKTSICSGGSSYMLSGGGGGAGGGVLILYANTINNAGAIHANGGRGGDGFYIGGTYQSGGGGGGGGGVVIIYYRGVTGSGMGNRTATGGSPGAYGTYGTSDSSGTAGLLLTYPM